MSKTTRKKLELPKDHIAKAVHRLKAADTHLHIYATEIPRDVYALLIFGLAMECSIERISESKIQLSSTKVHGKRFVVNEDSVFRKSYISLIKVLEASPDKRKTFMTSMEKYAEVCLSTADTHAETDEWLPLQRDRTTSSDTALSENDAIPLNSDDEGQTHLEPYVIDLPEYTGQVAPTEVRPYRNQTSTMPSPPSPPNPTDGRKIVKTEPFQAKYYQRKDNGIKRDSELINVVTYEDGSEAFQCRVCLDYTSDNHRSLNGHMGKHTTAEREKAKANPILHITDKWVPTQNQKSRITRLANEIADAMKLGLKTPEDIASAIIEARPEEPNNRNNQDGPEYAAMTPEQQIEAIRRILGTDQAVKDAHSQQEKVISGLQSQMDGMRAEMNQVRKDRDIAKNDLANYRAWMASAPTPDN